MSKRASIEIEEKTETKAEKGVRCKSCGHVITSQSLAVEPQESTFRNPGGYSFHVLCYSDAPGASDVGEATTLASWFPGYAWTFAICTQCHCHLGWWFSASDRFAGLIATRLIRQLHSLCQIVYDGRNGETYPTREYHAKKTSASWPHLTSARELLRAKKYDQALEEYLWVWNNVPSTDSEHADMREKLLPVETRQLIAAYPQAKLKFTELRDAAERDGNRHDWIILNIMLGDDSRTLAWFDKAKTDAKQKPDILKNSTFLEPLLFAKCRWTDAANYLYPEPLKKIKEYFKQAEAMKKPRPDTEVAEGFDPMPGMVLLVYGAYIGAGREAEAQKIADECYRLDDTPAMHQSLQNMAKAMRQAVALHSKAAK